MPSRSRRAAAEISKYKHLWEEAERQNRILKKRYMEISRQLAAYMLEHDLADHPQEQIEEVLHHGTT